MARMEKQLIPGPIRGTIGKQLVFKQYSQGTVVSKYPDMSRVKLSPLQKAEQKLFAQAVAYAREILHNPRKKAAYQKKIKEGGSVYHSAIKEYLEKNKTRK